MAQDPQIVPTAGVVVFNDGGQVLLVKHLEGASHLTDVYGLPAGRIQKGEASIDAAARELKEETGLEVNMRELSFVKQYCADIQRKDGIVKRFSVDIYVCTKYVGELVSSKETEPQWVSMQALNHLSVTLPNVKNAVRDAQSLLIEGIKGTL